MFRNLMLNFFHFFDKVVVYLVFVYIFVSLTNKYFILDSGCGFLGLSGCTGAIL